MGGRSRDDCHDDSTAFLVLPLALRIHHHRTSAPINRDLIGRQFHILRRTARVTPKVSPMVQPIWRNGVSMNESLVRKAFEAERRSLPGQLGFHRAFAQSHSCGGTPSSDGRSRCPGKRSIRGGIAQSTEYSRMTFQGLSTLHRVYRHRRGRQ
jgi:hypothetical protein